MEPSSLPQTGRLQLSELAAQTHRSEADLLSEALRRLHRIYVGADPPDGPSISTGPFSKLSSDRWAEVVLRQVDPLTFELREPFRFRSGDLDIVVPQGDVTDLASVPSLLTWLVPRYGRHTLAALLHDHLQKDLVSGHDRGHPEPGTFTSEEADTLFRNALRDTQVPFVRRWMMWAAVTLRTRWNAGPVARLAVGVYAGLYALFGLVIWPYLGIGVIRGWFDARRALIGAVALLSPLVLCWLWGRRWRFGLIAAVALELVAFATALVALLAVTYLGIEWLVELSQKGHRSKIFVRNIDPPASPPASP